MERKIVAVIVGLIIALIIAAGSAIWIWYTVRPPTVAPPYFIAFSNGDMSDYSRWIFVEDMTKWAEKYVENGTISFKWTNAYGDDAKQLSDIGILLAMKPDLLIVSPNHRDPIDPVVDMCNEAGVPLIIIDREVIRKPEDDPNDMYISCIVMDYCYRGRVRAELLAQLLTKKYGEPKGKAVEITGALGSSSTIDSTAACHEWLATNYADIHIIEYREGGWVKEKAALIMEDYLTKYAPGEFDVAFVQGDDMAIPALDVIKAAGRDELLGYVTGSDAALDALEAILAGEMAFTTEWSPFYGKVSFEYALKYLKGEEIPERVPYPMRGFHAFTPEHKAALEDIVSMMKEQGIVYTTTAMGYYDLFTVDVPAGPPAEEWYEKPPTY